MTMPTSASVIICTHNRADNLAENLPKVLNAVGDRQCEVIVVDNCSSDHSVQVATALGVRCIPENRLGLSHARNRGIKEASGDLVIFIDDDAWPETEWLPEIAEAFRDPSVACVGGRVIPAWKHLSGWPSWLHNRLIGFFTVIEYPDFRTLSYPNYPAGTNIAFRRQVLTEVGGFNPDLGRTGKSLNSGEETDLCLRIERAGHRIVYTPDAVVHHYVHEDRLKKEWVLDRSFWQGVSSGLIEQKQFGALRLIIKSFIYSIFTLASYPACKIAEALGAEKLCFFLLCQRQLCKSYLSNVWKTKETDGRIGN